MKSVFPNHRRQDMVTQAHRITHLPFYSSHKRLSALPFPRLATSVPSKMKSTSLPLHPPTSFHFPTAAVVCGRVRWSQPVAPTPCCSPLPPAATPAVPRRLLLPAAAGIWDFLSGGAGATAAATSLAVRQGMQLFRQVRLSEHKETSFASFFHFLSVIIVWFSESRSGFL